MAKQFMVTVQVTKTYKIPAQAESECNARANALKLINVLEVPDEYVFKHDVQTCLTEMKNYPKPQRCEGCQWHGQYLAFGPDKHRCNHLLSNGSLETKHGRVITPKWCPVAK